MKTIYLILLSLITAISCTADSENIQETSINGKWSLTIYEPGLSPTENYNMQQIMWNFQSGNSLTVEVETTVSSPPILESGNHDYSLINDKLIINNLEYDFSISINQLIISDDPASDGFRATFEKMIE